MIEAAPCCTDNTLPMVGHAWGKFVRDTIAMTLGRGSDRLRRVLYQLLDVSEGYASLCITNADLSRRVGCKPRVIRAELANLARLDVIHLVIDPSIAAGRRIIFAGHPGAYDVIVTLSTSRRVVERNPEFGPWTEPATDEPRHETEPDDGPVLLPFVRPVERWVPSVRSWKTR
jgi:hypothetical protein